MSFTQPRLWYRLRRPVVALILGLLPFWLFLGTSQQTTVNGRVVQDTSFNILGLILAIAGLVMAVKMLFKDGAYGEPQRWWLRSVLAVLAAALCIFQIGQTSGFYKVELGREFVELKTRLFGPSEPGARSLASELDKASRARVEQRAASVDQVVLRDDIATSVARIYANGTLFNLYAAACDDPGRRFRFEEAPTLLGDDDRAFIEKSKSLAEQNAADRVDCTSPSTREFMREWLADDVHRDRAALALQVEAYRKRFGDTPVEEVKQALSSKDVPARLGDTREAVQTGFNTPRVPVPVGNAGESKLDFPEQGIDIRFDAENRVKAITVRAPFAGRFVGLKIGDSRRTVNRVIGGAWINVRFPYDNKSAALDIDVRRKVLPTDYQWLDTRAGSDKTELTLAGPVYASYVDEITLSMPQPPRSN